VQRPDSYSRLSPPDRSWLRSWISRTRTLGALTSVVRRADKIKIRTGMNKQIAWALLADARTSARMEESDRYFAAMRDAIPRAAALHHQPDVLLRDGDEIICGCERCPGRGTPSYEASAGRSFDTVGLVALSSTNGVRWHEDEKLSRS
jgi:hypothetical protein